MVDLEMEGFTLHVPLKARMTAAEFMHVVERVEGLSRANERGMHVKHDTLSDGAPSPVSFTASLATSTTAVVPPAIQQVPASQAPVLQAHTPQASTPPPVPQTQYVPPVLAPPLPMQEEFRLPNEDLIRVQHLANQVKSHVEHIRRHEDVIARHDRHLTEILEYLQSLDKYIRK